MLSGLGLYGSLLGLLSLLLHLPWTARRPRRARRALPWGITAALAVAALLDGTHASYFAYFLPPGINDRLIRTALWLSLGALICFYTALLHTLHRRRYGRRSQTLLAVVSLLSIYTMIERREAFRPRQPPAPRPAVVEAGLRPQLWVVGIDTATFDAILPLAGQGRLPFLATLLKDGAYGRIETISPPRREALWITLATGKYPDKHGVTGARVYRAPWAGPDAQLRLLPVGISFRNWGTFGDPGYRLVTYSRESLTLWEILPRLGVSSGMVGWPASAPVPEETVFALTERFFTDAPEPQSSWPPDVASRARLFRLSPQELDPALRRQLGAGAPPVVLESLTGDLWRQSIFSFLVEQDRETGAVFLMLPGLRAVSRRFFGGFDAVQFQGDPTPEAREAAERVAAYYAQLDAFLAELWARGEGPRVMAVVSAAGAEPRGFRERLLGGMEAGSALEGSLSGASDGILLLYGEGIRPGALLTGARVADVTPTLLYALGFPVARDSDGQVLTSAFDKGFLARHPLTVLPSYEALPKPRS
ncbi:MAG TPA: alkaline phosphatase family protein [Thermoanaerobaculia bacterium]|nr:alkaline phosphatase family protein [Thermoanaerobaculia bacterium]